MSTNDGDTSVRQRFEECERIIEELERGETGTKEIQPKLEKCVSGLEEVSRDISNLALFSRNERFQELSTSSLHFLLAPAYLGVAHQNRIIMDPTGKIEELKLAKAYYRDFLNRLFEYEVITFKLPWMTDEDDEVEEEERAGTSHTVKGALSGEAQRQEKLTRYRQQKTLEDNWERIRLQRQRENDDESLEREYLVVQLRIWALKTLAEIGSIEQELPMLEHMMKLRSGQVQPEPAKTRPPPRKPFIIARNEEQKKVFGLGYPSVPTVTVDEWYEGMVKSGRFGGHGDQPATQGGADSGKVLHPSDSENEDEVDDDLVRARKEAWDEYKDTHRRGWGNTHNKG